MKMTPALLWVGALLVFWSAVFVSVLMPAITMDRRPSEIWRPFTAEEAEGSRLYVQNGCSYCHTRFIRTVDWDIGAERIAKAGDYHAMRPAILGTQRTGPDLSQEGGERTDDWHISHFMNPRHTRPISVMPAWAFLGEKRLVQLTRFLQAMGGKQADHRVARQHRWKERSSRAYLSGPDQNVRWLHDQVPPVWRAMPNPYPPTAAALGRGKKIYEDFCVNCHGPMGDGAGQGTPWIHPPPLNFTTLRRHLVQGKYIGGIFYYQIMNGITGTAMPYFKRELESEKIWDVSNYLAVSFLGYTDAQTPPLGIDAAYEPPWENPYRPPKQVEPSGEGAQSRPREARPGGEMKHEPGR